MASSDIKMIVEVRTPRPPIRHRTFDGRWMVWDYNKLKWVEEGTVETVRTMETKITYDPARDEFTIRIDVSNKGGWCSVVTARDIEFAGVLGFSREQVFDRLISFGTSRALNG